MAISRRGLKLKGDRAENEVVDLLRPVFGDHVVRPRLEGVEDKGDIAGVPRTAIQCKNYADVLRAIREGLEAVADQRDCAGAEWGAAWIRRRGGRWIVVMEPEDWIALVRAAVE